MRMKVRIGDANLIYEGPAEISGTAEIEIDPDEEEVLTFLSIKLRDSSVTLALTKLELSKFVDALTWAKDKVSGSFSSKEEGEETVSDTHRAAQVTVLEKALELARNGDAMLEYMRIRFKAVKGSLSYTARDTGKPQGGREGGIRILPVGNKLASKVRKSNPREGKYNDSEGRFQHGF